MVRWALRISNSTDFKLTTNILSDFTNRILCTFHQTHFPLRDTVYCIFGALRALRLSPFPHVKTYRSYGSLVYVLNEQKKFFTLRDERCR